MQDSGDNRYVPGCEMISNLNSKRWWDGLDSMCKAKVITPALRNYKIK